MRRPTFDQLLRTSDDFKLCDGTFALLAERDNRLDVSTLEGPVRVVTLVWHSLGLVENGGFEYLLGADYPGDPGFVQTAAAYATIGSAAYACFQQALGMFPSSRPDEDVAQRRVTFERVPQATRDRIDNAFWGSVPEVKAKLAAYIRANAALIQRAVQGDK